MLHVFDFPVRLVEGPGSMERLGQEAARLKYRNAIIITDRGVRRAGLLEGVLTSLGNAGISVSVFDDVEVDPGRATVSRCAQAVRDAGADVIVTVGGGSAMCAAKGAALVAANGGDIKDYKGVGKYGTPPMPVIAIPTTAGSGSEVSPRFIIKDEENGVKMSIGGPDCYPVVSVLDPLLLVDLPYTQAVVSSMDALSHAVEAFVTRGASVFTDAYAFWAVDIFYRHMEEASVPGGSLESKSLVLSASTIANIACGTAGLGLVHALHQGFPEVSHGAICGMLLPWVMEFNQPVCLPKMARLALALGVPPGLPDEEAAAMGIANLRLLYERLGFPGRVVPDPGWTVEMEDRVEKIFRYSRKNVDLNPRVASAEDLKDIIRKVTGQA